MANQINVGLIGFGVSGRVFHANLLRDSSAFKIVAVSTSREAEAHAVLPQATVFKDAEALIANPNIDVVINTAPNAQHFTLSREALLAGKHVVVEKPFTLTSQESRELIQVATASRRLLTVYQNRRWDGDFLTVQKLIASNQLGDILQFESHFDRWRPTNRPERWREQAAPGSGILYDLGPHLLDQALVLFGKPDTIWADILTQKSQAEADDYFHLVLGYGRLRCLLHSSSFASAPTPRFQVFGSEASFIKYGLDPQEGQLKDGMSPQNSAYAFEAQSEFGTLQSDALGAQKIETERGQYLEFYEKLAHAIYAHDPAQLPVQPSEALTVIELIESALESSRSGRTIQL